MSRLAAGLLILCCCLLVSGCRITMTLEPLAASSAGASAPAAGEDAAVAPRGQAGDDVGDQAGDDAFAELGVVRMTVAQPNAVNLPELASASLGEEWIALAQPLPPPYAEAAIITATTSGGWVLITPDPARLGTTRVDLQLEQGDVYAQRSIASVIVAPGSDFDSLRNTRSGWYDPASQSVLWVADVYVPGTGALYSILPSLPSSLAVAPGRLRCPPPAAEPGAEPGADEIVACELSSRFFPSLSATYTGVYTTTAAAAILPVVDFNALLSQNPGANYGACNEQQTTCVLSGYGGQPDWQALHDQVCYQVLRCQEQPSDWCVVWVCS